MVIRTKDKNYMVSATCVIADGVMFNGRFEGEMVDVEADLTSHPELWYSFENYEMTTVQTYLHLRKYQPI